MFDRDQSGFIDDKELQQALSSAFHYNFNIATIRFLIFLFKDPPQPLTLGPKEFVALWNCLAQWRVSFFSFLLLLSHSQRFT
ncbi:putative guanylate cyclase activating protein [Lupinus albus]|uniref:Putative guanylate cyclase activating protein n=1 Tax=Lupinus albus TaxID=3870 RepID=A0A6A4N9R0_LUPAL|nr:putative guanylate cyclase activating protein [Lupinus albus]